MLRDPETLATIISNETGLDFIGATGIDDEGHTWILLRPADHDTAHTFSIRILLKWRRLSICFEPGKFAGPLLKSMSDADENARAVFHSVMQNCEQHGASITMRANGSDYSYGDSELWNRTWKRLTFGIRKGNIEIGAEDGRPDDELVREWALRFIAAVIALLPLEERELSDFDGFPEGAVQTITVIRYERDRRNRAAALAIHGCNCFACGMNFEECYGPAASGYIEVHHVVPVSEIGENYVIDPGRDLVPLCSNCHSVTHRRSPPFTIEELREFLRSSNANTSIDCLPTPELDGRK